MPDPGPRESLEPGPLETLDPRIPETLDPGLPETLDSEGLDSMDEDLPDRMNPDNISVSDIEEEHGSSSDPLQVTDLPTKRRILTNLQHTNILPRKRPTPLSSQQQRSPTSGNFFFGPTPGNHVFSSAPEATLNPNVHSVPEAIQLVRNVLVQAANMSQSQQEQTNLLDLLEVVRDFTETGRVRKQESAILAHQIQRLETVSKAFSKNINSQTKATEKLLLQPQANATPPPPPPPTQQRRQALLPASYAAAAASGAPRTAEWTTVASKKKVPGTAVPKNSLSSRQLVLIHKSTSPINSLTLRNNINNAFANKGVTAPVIVSATRSKQENIVLTTTPAFNAQYLLENKEIWKHTVQFHEALPIVPWYKGAIHGVPTSLESLDVLKDEIRTFNNGLQIVGQPYWLSHESRRREKMAGSVCVAFASQKDADQATRNRLYLLGLSLRAEKQHSIPASTQCYKCQRFGHTEDKCRNLPACKICSEMHPTAQHRCNTCNAKGKTCIHTVRKCANCKEAHTADDKDCETYLATRNARGHEHSNAPNRMEC